MKRVKKEQGWQKERRVLRDALRAALKDLKRGKVEMARKKVEKAGFRYFSGRDLDTVHVAVRVFRAMSLAFHWDWQLSRETGGAELPYFEALGKRLERDEKEIYRKSQAANKKK